MSGLERVEIDTLAVPLLACALDEGPDLSWRAAISLIAPIYGIAHIIPVYVTAYKILKADSALHRLQRRQNYSF